MVDMIIKKYSNRKLYDTSTKKFITLKDIARMLNEGKNIKVIDKKSGKDVTSHVVAALLQKHYDQGKKLLDIPDESPLELIKNKVKMLKIKRSIEILYELVKLNFSDKKTVDKIVDQLIEEGFINDEMAIEAEETLWRLMKERNVKLEQKIAKRLKMDIEECEKLKDENTKLKAEIKKLRKAQKK